MLARSRGGRITRHKVTFGAYFRANYWLYLLVAPGLIYLIIFQYLPMFGIVIAFKNLSLAKGIMASPWVGLDNFTRLFRGRDFGRVLRNSLTISLMKLLFCFPMPILLALALNEVRSRVYKRAIQTIVYLPHFISWVIISGILTNLLASNGSLHIILTALNGGKSADYLISARHFRWILVFSDIWKEVGWGTVVYLAGISGISGELYEAAEVDGASRMRRIWHVTLPGLKSTIIVLLILRMGSIISNGFEQIFTLYSPMVYDVADVFETYSYRVGMIEGRYSYSAAVGIFQSLVGLVMIFITNKIANLYSESTLF